MKCLLFAGIALLSMASASYAGGHHVAGASVASVYGPPQRGGNHVMAPQLPHVQHHVTVRFVNSKGQVIHQTGSIRGNGVNLGYSIGPNYAFGGGYIDSVAPVGTVSQSVAACAAPAVFIRIP
jgi:hypothetical protein